MLCLCLAGEQIEMGGIVDPERGALIYRKTTEVETVEPEIGSEFSHKKITKVTSETSWIGKAKETDKQALVKETEEEEAVKPWHDEEVETNPLYSTSDYVSDFQNPIYTNRQSMTEEEPVMQVTEMSDVIPLVSGGKRGSRGHRGSSDTGQEYIDYLSAEPGQDNVDTLF